MVTPRPEDRVVIPRPLEGNPMKRVLWAVPVAVVVAGAAAAASAQPPSARVLTGVAVANTRSPGYAPAIRLSPELSQTVVAQGAMKVENPTAQIASTATTATR
jgi:hypothetical protein